MSTDFRGDPSRGAAGGAGPGAEPQLQRPLPGPRLRPVEGDVHLHREHDAQHPRAAAGPHGGHPHRRATPSRRSCRIARRYLIPKEQEANGLAELKVDFTQRRAADHHPPLHARVRRALPGARDRRRVPEDRARRAQERQARHRVDRKLAMKYLGMPRYRYGMAEREDQVGIVTGLAWTEMGGEILTTEATVMPGKGKLIITGKLGEVMQESAQAAMSYVRSRAERFGIDASCSRTTTSTSTCPRAPSPRTARPPASPWAPRWSPRSPRSRCAGTWR